MSSKPWISGPKELLDHAASHLADGQGFDYRIALISIDNAVELTIRTFLSLPKRARGSDGPSRKDFQAAGNSFPALLDLLEEYASDNLEGIELGDIEWYHRVRNTLYHDGNGVTVESTQVEAYLEVAKLLFKNLFGTPLDTESAPTESTSIGRFMLRWAQVEHNLRILYSEYLSESMRATRTPLASIEALREVGAISNPLAERLHELRVSRNEIVHGHRVPDASEFKSILASLTNVVVELGNAAGSKTGA